MWRADFLELLVGQIWPKVSFLFFGDLIIIPQLLVVRNFNDFFFQILNVKIVEPN